MFTESAVVAARSGRRHLRSPEANWSAAPWLRRAPVALATHGGRQPPSEQFGECGLRDSL